jgi:hypothetical protein
MNGLKIKEVRPFRRSTDLEQLNRHHRTVDDSITYYPDMNRKSTKILCAHTKTAVLLIIGGSS